MIAVVDYGMGNLRSVEKGLIRVGLDAKVTSAKKDLEDAAAVVLPGVGAFRDCMINLDRLGLIEPIRSAVKIGKPFLGICLGLQALFTVSEEFGLYEGLNIFPGRVVRFPENLSDPQAKDQEAPALKVPHMGWNQIQKHSQPAPLKDIPSGSYVYFVHSYYVAPEDKSIIATTTDYGIEFVSGIAKDNLFACQFHPEKSQGLGLKLLKNFGEMVNGK